MTDTAREIAEGLSPAQRAGVERLPAFIGVNWPTYIDQNAYGVSARTLKVLNDKGLLGTRGRLVVGLNGLGQAVQRILKEQGR